MVAVMRFIDPERFQHIVQYARKHNPFYAQWIPENGPVPILTRRMLQDNNDLILNGNPVLGKTSGSTSIPIRIYQPASHNELDLRDIAAMAKMMGGFLPRTLLIYPRSANDPPELLNVMTPLPEQLEALKKNYATRAATAIITYPSNAVLLAQEIVRLGADFRFIKRIGLISESIDPVQIQQMKQGFPQARIWSSYSASEFGLISFQCPFEPEFHHLSTHKLGVEILDEQDRDCELGQIGRIVLTDYLNKGMPLIRYEIGDLASFGNCPCGRIHRPALQQILGKVRGSLLHRDGHRIPFIDLSIAISSLPGLKQYQLIQHELMRFTLKLVASTNEQMASLVDAIFLKEFGYLPSVEIEWHDSIPRESNGKYHATICHV